MSATYSGIDGYVGNTPLIRLRRLSELTGCEILGKAEFMNPAGSVKDRAAYGIITDAEEQGRLKSGATIVEGTAGNTGIGLVVIGRARGYRTVIVIPNNQSPEKMHLLRTLGAEVKAVPEKPYKDPENYNHIARRLAKERGWFWANQFDNTANPLLRQPQRRHVDRPPGVLDGHRVVRVLEAADEHHSRSSRAPGPSLAVRTAFNPTGAPVTTATRCSHRQSSSWHRQPRGRSLRARHGRVPPGNDERCASRWRRARDRQPTTAGRASGPRSHVFASFDPAIDPPTGEAAARVLDHVRTTRPAAPGLAELCGDYECDAMTLHLAGAAAQIDRGSDPAGRRLRRPGSTACG